MRRFVGAGVVVLVAFAFAAAEEINAVVTKIDGNKVTFKKFEFKKGGDGGKAEEKTLPLAANAKFTKGKFTKGDDMKFAIVADGDLEGGREALEKRVKDAVAAAAKKPDDKKDDDKKDDEQKKKKKGKGFGGGFNVGGVRALLITEGEAENAKITEVRVLPAFGGFKKKKDAN
jgi:hypothetical protein